MRNILTIAQKELSTYFVSPVAYVVAALFLVVMGYLFAVPVVAFRNAPIMAIIRSLFFNMAVVLLLLSPALTMRLLAEEQRMGTIELLLTSPVRDWEVVLGKFLGSLGFYTVMLLLTGFFPFIATRVGNPDLGPILSSYLGAYLMGAAFLAVGVFASSLTQNQIIAAVAAFAILLLLWLIDATANIASGNLAPALRYLSLITHFDDFTKGVVDTSHLVYYLSVIAAFLFLATRSLETRRWR